MGGDHHDLGERMKIPDYRIYKVEDHPELVQHRDRLAAKGLKDPWLRNEAWRFNKEEFGTRGANLRTRLFTGFRLGVGALLLTIAVETAFKQFSNSDNSHGHH
ncbi:NADH dehydrogenase [ubiquinone] 1 beta subcomplex subunit 3 [Cimex lectularius]|uniref:NADH dehydrogenase [ubiquinone] 1 beta subcomplex subunit 3 n=1 Tax=Cimex lectularius TaxID=79782 RepID=A0A8I6THT9_CIMLE|nr:NADH dehydrogenase [ubiquinone] 1 beta subcomplex subunit 3 [Cimex lectularius]